MKTWLALALLVFGAFGCDDAEPKSTDLQEDSLITDLEEELDAQPNDQNEDLSVEDSVDLSQEDQGQDLVDIQEEDQDLDLHDETSTDPDLILDTEADQEVAEVEDGQEVVDCDETCQTLDLTLELNGKSRAFERAHYGLTSPENPGDPYTLYVEVSAGGRDGCPSSSSPDPDLLLSLSNLPLSWEGTYSEGLYVNLFDFSGEFLDIPLLSGEGEATLLHSSVCPACFGAESPSDPDGFVSLTLSSTLGTGGAEGQIYATHCDSLDL